MQKVFSDSDVTYTENLWHGKIPPLSAFPTTKDIRYHPFFLGGISRFLWKVFTIRLSKAGLWFLMATFLFAGFGSLSIQVQAYTLFCYAIALWIMAAVCVHFLRPRVSLTARHADRARAGETMTVDVELKQLGRRPMADLTILPHGLPPAVDAVPENGVDIPVIEPGKSVHLKLGLLCKQRGVHKLKGYRVETDFPFGLLRAYAVFSEHKPLLVYPAFTPLARLEIPTGRQYQPGGVALASNLGESFEFLGNREYQEGDNIRDIDWRATARLSKPIIREYREEYFLRVGVVLDTHIPTDKHSERGADFERAISVAASVSDYMSRQDYIVDLFAAGPNLYHLTAGRSLAYLDQILDILACVNVNPNEPFETLEPEILENLENISAVICVFMDWNQTRQAFVHKLAQAGAGVKVIVVRDTACTIDPMTAIDTTGPIAVIGHTEFESGIEEL